MTKLRGFGYFNLAAKWKKNIGGTASYEGWFILTNLDGLQGAISAYKQRFDIEEMFRDFKKGGYRLEDTKVAGERLEVLILLIAIAYLSATIAGQQIKDKGVQKYIGRIKENNRLTRRHSSFYIGLYGYTWLGFWDTCQEFVEQLMRINLNKRAHYQRGLRAMRLIQSVFLRILSPLQPESLKNFPKGSCGDTSLILATYLEENGYGKFDYVSGKRWVEETKQSQSHAWIEKNKLIIDITADQFEDFSDKVFVGMKSGFHETFKNLESNQADLKIYDEHTQSELKAVYHKVCSLILSNKSFKLKLI